MLTITSNVSSIKPDLKNRNKRLSKYSILTTHTFEKLNVSKKTLARLVELKTTHMTLVQSFSIPLQISGYDIFVKAKTGSGKTLSFIIPSIEFASTVLWKTCHGLLAIIISPTRELTMQSYSVLKDMMKYQSFSFGVFMGGSNKKTEQDKIKKGLNILVATPGRLLDHLKSSINLKTNNIQFLTIDEADRCLEAGFEDEISEILKILPKKRQTALFSATQTSTLGALAKKTFPEPPVFLNIDYFKAHNRTPQTKHGFLVSELSDKIVSLLILLKKNQNKKIIVFFNTCNEVDFFSQLFKKIGVFSFPLHGKMKQTDRTVNFFSFCKNSEGTLLSTDIAARGLDFPGINYIIQYSSPLDPKEYIHRAGRTGRGTNLGGTSVIFLLPSEIGFLKYLKDLGLGMNEYTISIKKHKNLWFKLKKILEKNFGLKELAIKSAKSFYSSYLNHSLKSIFCIKNIDLQSLLISYCVNPSKTIDYGTEYIS
mmetsp:Transcript_48939/g.76359  ORF Transcript_48939/g.76359 Transcript_48939/m.76359 type:complete len:482 (+) Transcript_48939:64-1509(+)